MTTSQDNSLSPRSVLSAAVSTQRTLQPGQHLDSGGSLLPLACGLSAPGTTRSEVSVVLPAPEAQRQLCPPSAQGDGAAQGPALSSSTAWSSSTALGHSRLCSPAATSNLTPLGFPLPSGPISAHLHAASSFLLRAGPRGLWAPGGLRPLPQESGCERVRSLFLLTRALAEQAFPSKPSVSRSRPCLLLLLVSSGPSFTARGDWLFI